MQKAVGGRQMLFILTPGLASDSWNLVFPTYRLRHTTCQTPGTRNPHPVLLPHLPPPDANRLYFQRHSRFQRVTTFVFYNITALPPPVERRPFVFIDIAASLGHFLKLLVYSFTTSATSCRRLRHEPTVPPFRNPLKCSRQSAVNRRQSAEGTKQKAEGGKQMIFILTPDFWLLNSESWLSP